MSEWLEIRDKAAQKAALALARGAYQRAFLEGHEALSGSTIKGRARKYAFLYARSRASLLARLTKAGIKWTERRGPHGRRVLVLG